MNGLKQLSAANSRKHAIIYGSSGTGKSAVVLLSSIFRISKNYSSLIIHDPSGELWNNSAAFLARKQGYTVKRLAFHRPSISDGFNPMIYAKDESGLNKLAELIIKTALGSNSKDPFWNEKAIDVLKFLMAVAQTRDSQYHTLAYVYRLMIQLEAQPEQFRELVLEANNQTLTDEAEALLNGEPKLRSGTLATIKSALQRYGSDTKVALVSSFDSMELSSMHKRPMAIYVQVPAAEHEYYRTPNSIFWEILFSELLKELPQDGDREIFCLLDEAGWLNLPNLATTMAVARKYFGVLLAVQNAEQLVAVHGKEGAATIEANAWAKLFFTAQSPQASVDLARILGTTEISIKDGQTIIRSLMSEAEIRMMDPARGILLCGNHGPMYVKLKPYYLQSRLRGLAKYSRAYPIPQKSKLPTTKPSTQLLTHTQQFQHE